jgi:glucose-6-phosphate 1-dehydrogenase
VFDSYAARERGAPRRRRSRRPAIVSGVDADGGVAHGRVDDDRSAPARARLRTRVIFGVAGDLTSRLLLPGLGGLLASRSAGALRLIRSDRDDLGDEGWPG